MDPALRSKIEEASKKYFELTAGPIYRVYADMEYLQDFRIGALVSLLRKKGVNEAKVGLDYIRSCMSAYNERLDFETAKYFPMMKTTDAELDEIIRQNPLGVAYISPFTSTWSILLDVLSAVRFHNDKVSERTVQTEFVLNLTTVPWHSDLQARLRHQVYTAGSSDAYITFRSTPRYSEGYDFYHSAAILFIWDIEYFINGDPALRNAICDNMKFYNNQVLAKPYVKPELKIAPDKVKDSVYLTEEMLDRIMNFEWLPTSIIV